MSFDMNDIQYGAVISVDGTDEFVHYTRETSPGKVVHTWARDGTQIRASTYNFFAPDHVIPLIDNHITPETSAYEQAHQTLMREKI